MKRAFLIMLIGILVFSSFIFMNGCSKKEKVIKIGAILPLSGEAASYGKSSQEGIELAVEQINVNGGINGNKIEVIYGDSKADPKTGVSAFNKLISVDNIKVVIGAMASSVTLAIAPIAEENEIILFSHASSNPKITDAGDYIFRNDVSDIFDGKMMAEACINQLDISKAAIIYINNDYGLGIKNLFASRLEELGGVITSTQTFNQGETNFRTQLSKIKESNPQAIYVIGHKEQIPLFKQYKELGLNYQILAPAMINDPAIIEEVGNIIKGAIYTSRTFDVNSTDKNVRYFIEAFRKKYNHDPDNWAAQAYDALKIIAYVIENGIYDSEFIKTELYSIKNLPGVTGNTTFDANGDVIKKLAIKKI